MLLSYALAVEISWELMHRDEEQIAGQFAWAIEDNDETGAVILVKIIKPQQIVRLPPLSPSVCNPVHGFWGLGSQTVSGKLGNQLITRLC